MKKNLNIANRFCQPLRPSLNRGSVASQLKWKGKKERHTHNFYSGLRTALQSSFVVLELSETVKIKMRLSFTVYTGSERLELKTFVEVLI